MADAEVTKTTSTVKTGGEAKLSKTKKATAKKTRTVKTKIVKTKAEEVQQVVVEAPKVEKVVTARKKRISEKVKTRDLTPQPEPVLEPIASMKLTELDAAEYGEEEYEELENTRANNWLIVLFD